jgi:hypothetical protein
MKAIAIAALSLLIIAGTVGVAEAQSGASLEACRADAVRLCGGDPTGGTATVEQRRRIAVCMLGHIRQLSAPCRATLRAWGL